MILNMAFVPVAGKNLPKFQKTTTNVSPAFRSKTNKMTTHYTIHSIKTETAFKITYRNGKFKRIEHLRGKLTEKIVKNLGVVIPVSESDLNAYKTTFKDSLKYTAETKQKSLFKQFNDAWFAFYEVFTGFPPKFTGTDGRHLKQIITYLKDVSGGEKEALNLWQVMLHNWKHLDEFHQKNTDLKYINSQLNKILQNVQRVNKKGSTGLSDDYLKSIVNDLRA